MLKLVYEGETILKKSAVLIIIVLIGVSAYTTLANTESTEADCPDYSGECGPYAKYNISTDGTLEITGSGEMYRYDTTEAPWHGYHDDITKIIIGDNITKLGTSAFLDCKNVTELTIPITLNSVVSDKCPVFEGCCNIEKINFTCGYNGYTYSCPSFEPYRPFSTVEYEYDCADYKVGFNYAAYEGSNSWYQHTPWYQSRDTLKEINFADGIEIIGSDSFRELNITSIVLPDSVKFLGNHCFYNCTKLTDLTIPVSLNSYGGDETYPAFHGCMAVQKVTFTKGNGVPFDYGDWLDYHYKLAPWNMNSEIAKTIVISDDVTSLGGGMFLHCNIKELTIPVSLYLNHVTPFNVVDTPFHQYYEDTRFDNLEKVTITKGSGRGYDYDIDKIDHVLCCPWNDALNIESVTVEEGVTYLGSYLFYKCNINNLVLPNTLASLGESPFYQCKIKNLTIPISLNATWLDDHAAFDSVSGIKKINFTPGSGYGFDYATDKGSNCWYQLTPWYQCRDTIKEIDFSEGITHIGSNAFYEQLNLTSLVLPKSLESLGQNAFYNLKDLLR